MAGIAGEPSPKPSDLPSQPGDIAEGSALGSYAIPKNSALMKYSMPETAAPPATSDSTGMMSKGLDAAGRVFDYPGGIVRTAGAAVGAAATGQPNAVTMNDVKNAAVGKAPSSAEYLRRLGVSEGGSVNLPILGKVTLRGAEGLAMDVLSDPLTLIAKAAKSAPYIKTLLETPGRASEALGEAVYKSAIVGKSEKAARAASTAGDVLIEQGAPIGGSAKIAQKIDDAAQTMGNIRQALFDRFNQLDGKVSIGPDSFKRSIGVIENMKKNPTLRPLGETLENELTKYSAEGFVPIENMTSWMNQTFDSLPKSAMKGSSAKNVSNMFKSALVEDFRTTLQRVGNKAEPGLGDALIDVNQKWGALLDVGSAVNQNAPSIGKQIDSAVLAAGGVKAYMVKKSYDMATGPYARTLVGKALMEAGKTDVVNRLSRQVIKDITAKDQSGETP